LIQLPHYEFSNDEQTLDENVYMRDEYKMLYDFIMGVITEDDFEEGYIFDPNIYNQKDEIIYNYLRYQFYIDHQTSVHDYVLIDKPMGASEGKESSVYRILMSKVLFFVAGSLSVILTLSICFLDYDSDRLKHLTQSNVKRREIFLGKFVFTFLSLVVVMGSIFGIILLVSPSYGVQDIMIITQTEVVLISSFSYLFASFIIAFSYGLLLSFLLILIRLYTNNSLISTLITIGTVLLFFGIYYLITPQIAFSNGNNNSIEYLFFVNSLTNRMSFTFTSYYYILSSIIIVSGLIVLLIIVRLRTKFYFIES
jgi:hypothetical protein